MELLFIGCLAAACLWRPGRPVRWLWPGLWGPRKEEAESQINIRQEMDKKTKRLWTHISYRENGRKVTVKAQQGLTLALGEMVLQLDLSGAQAPDAKRQPSPAATRPRAPRLTSVKPNPAADRSEPLDAAQVAELF